MREVRSKKKSCGEQAAEQVTAHRHCGSGLERD
jgi:hypothetical protein